MRRDRVLLGFTVIFIAMGVWFLGLAIYGIKLVIE